LDGVDLLLHPLDETRQLVLEPLVADLDVAPVVGRNLRQQLGVDVDALVQEDLARVVREAGSGRLPFEQAEDLLPRALADDADLVLLVLAELRDLVVLDGPRAIVLLDALAGEDAGVDDRTLDARGDAEAGVADLAGLLAEDRAQELLLGRELRLAL